MHLKKFFNFLKEPTGFFSSYSIELNFFTDYFLAIAKNIQKKLSKRK